MKDIRFFFTKTLLGASALILLLLFAELPAVFAAQSSKQTGALMQIKNDFEAGKISFDRKVLLQVQAIKTPDNLPLKYQNLPEGEFGNNREATMILKDIKVNWDSFTPETRLAISNILTRQVTAFTFDSPSGFFKLHYDITGTHAVSPSDTNFNSIPDFVERMAAYSDSSRQKHLSLGFLEPPPDNGLGGDDKYDVYFENMGFYGYAVPESFGARPWNDYYSHLVLNNDFVGFPPNTDPEGDTLGAAKVTIAHEYHHAVQFGYDANEPSWFMELDATYAEDIVFDATNDNYNYLGSYTNFPAKSLMENSNHMYASFIWGLYLAQNFDTSLMRACWEGARYTDIFSAISDSLFANYGWTQDSAIADFITWNFATSTRNDFLHHEEAANYPLVNVGVTHNVFPVSLRNSPDSPAGYGSNYVKFVPGSSVGTLRLVFDGVDSRDWAAYIIISTDINHHQYQKLELTPSIWNDTVLVEKFEDLYAVTLVGINISEFSSGAFFSYSASVNIPHAVSTSLLTLDTIIYSGGTRPYSFQVSNPSDFDDVYWIMYWDELGWINSDTISRAIGALDDTTFTISVHPPQGTPLTTISQLHFKAVSLNDTTVSDEQSIPVQTVLYKGDSNFSGSITILDLNYMVNWIFRLGPQPIPVKAAGDFNCDEKTNILDLNSNVGYIFRGLGLPVCNPY